MQFRMSEFDATRMDTLELRADQFESLGEILRQTGEENDAVHAEEVRVRTANRSYLVTADDGQVILREESDTAE